MVDHKLSHCDLLHDGNVWILSCPLVDNGEGWMTPLRMALSLEEVDGMTLRKDDGAYLLKTALKIEGGCLKRV